MKTMKNYLKIFILIPALFLIQSCSGGGGGGTTGGNPTTTNPTSNTSSLQSNLTSYHLPLADINQPKNKTITITNSGTSETSTLTVSVTGESQISSNVTDCQNRSLAVGGTCQITVSLLSPVSGTYSKNISINSGNGILSFNIVGYVYNSAEINFMISKITDKEGVLHSGSWDFLDSDLANNALIIHALGKADAYSSVQLYTPNIDFTIEPSSNWLKVDKGLNFLMFDDFDNSLLVFDKDQVSTDYDTTLSKWSDTIYTKPKQISPGLLYKNNQIYKLIYGVDIPNFTALFDKYQDSRKIINVDGSNNVTGSTSSAKAQFAYLVDDKRWPANYFIENAMKEVMYLFESYKDLNKTTQLNDLSRLMVAHWEYTLPEIQDLFDPLLGVSPNVVNPIQNLKYNPNEFDYSTFQIPGNFPVSPQTTRNTQLWFVNDYINQGFGCRNLAYTVLNLVFAYQNGNWTTAEKAQVENLVKAGLIELKQSWACKYNSTTKKYTSQVDGPSLFNNNNAIPIIAKIYHRLPETLVSAVEKKQMFTQLIQELAVGGSIDLDDSNGDPLIRAEALDFLMEIK